MKRPNYLKEVRWDNEDDCYIGSLPDLCGDCCHGSTQQEVYEQLIEIESSWLDVFDADDKPYPIFENGFSCELKRRLDELGKSQELVSQETGISKQLLSEMKLGKRRCTVENDLRLSLYFNTSKGSWLKMQTNGDIKKLELEKGKILAEEVKPLALRQA